MVKAKIHITLKSGILDPQGRTIQQSLGTLGFTNVQDVQVGKYLEIELADSDQDTADEQVKAMCQKLLVNTVIENFSYELVPLKG
ncbi:MAG: phosphoribosylformylglycinamidine synthase subunit PurS [Nitrospirae bacterium]|nr:phosphoribosylformylglycinamidine synthase subunit PurS [Nitrospirota bacterium]